MTTSSGQTQISLSTSTSINNVDWTVDEYVGRVEIGTSWFNLVAISTSPKVAVLEGYDLSNSPIGLVDENGAFAITSGVAQTISGIDIYAESIQAT